MITELSGSQIPEGVADLPYPNMTVYQLEPSGLTFTTPAVVEVVVPDAISVIDGVLTVETGLLLSESDGVVEPMGNQRLVPSETDPDAMVLTGELEHFSSGIFSEWRQNGLYLTANPPEQADDGERFDVSITVDARPDFGRLALGPDYASLTDGSFSPVAVDPAGGGVTEVDFSKNDSGAFETVVDYLCDGSGLGDWAVDVKVGFHLSPSYPIEYTVLLAQPVICRRGLSVTERPSVWADRLSTGSGDNDVLVAGWEPHTWDLSTGNVTDLGEVGAQFNHLHPVQDGLYGNTVLGREWVWSSEGGWVNISGITPNQGRQFVQGPDGDVYGSDAFGQAKSVGEDPDVGGFRTWEYALDQLEAYWADGERGVAVRTTGDGNSAFNVSIPVLIAVGAVLASTGLDGNALDEILDQYQRLVKDLECSASALLPALLVCMFTAGERNPGALVEGQEAPDGLTEAFIVDTEQETATTVERWRAPGVGAAAFQYEGRTIVAWADQVSGSAEFREVTPAGGVGLSLSLLVGQWCARIIDFAVTRSGEFAALSCGGDEEQELETKYLSLSIPWAF